MREAVGGAAFVFGALADAAGRVYFCLPIHRNGERSGGEQLLFGVAFAGARHIGGGDGYEMGCGVVGVQGFQQAERACQIGFYGAIQWVVKSYRCGGVDEDVAAG